MEFSPEPSIVEYILSSDWKSEMRTPVRDYRRDSVTPIKTKYEASSSFSYPLMSDGQNVQQNPDSSSW
ncbi:hypothetical protein GIB67_025391 [Kingdonia uniflora]|uniref:Uncharacterized protein n=1 Tax=Kingdonia uniflora TaxID=39325 RepID=A0A7J7NBN2_9MAGN|nr:hypothetical protein GIB67_025391 [Kingdonia uniflora]